MRIRITTTACTPWSRDAEVPVYAAGTVGQVIAGIDDAKRAQWSAVYGEEWPAETYYPNSLLADREQVKLDEFTFTVRELGPGKATPTATSS